MYEALLDTFKAYPDAQIRADCLERVHFLKDSLNVSNVGHERIIDTLLLLGLYDKNVTFYAAGEIGTLKLHYFEDTIFTLFKLGSPDYFGVLSEIGGHRTSEFFKSIIQHYNFDEYEWHTIGALGYMNDSAFYLIPEIKKYRDSLELYRNNNCPTVSPEGSRCWDLDYYIAQAPKAQLIIWNT